MRMAMSLALVLLAALPAGSVSAQNAPAANPANAPAEGAPLPPPYITRQAEIEVPFSVKAGASPDAQPSAVRIYVSWDAGATWHLYQEKRPEEGKFRFRAKQDGEFWFATQTIDGTGRAPRQAPKAPQLRLVLDTQPPVLQLTAVPSSDGKVTVSWAATDPHLNATTLKIEYQPTSGEGPWQTIVASQTGPTAPGQSVGQVLVQPTSNSGAINLRAEISDVAGNTAYAAQRVTLARPAPGAMAAARPPHAGDSAATPWPAEDATPVANGVKTLPLAEVPAQRGGNTPNSPQHLPVVSSTQPAVTGAPSYDSLPAPGEQSASPDESGSSGPVLEGPSVNAPRPAYSPSSGGIPASPANSVAPPPRTFEIPREPRDLGSLTPAPSLLPAPGARTEEMLPPPSPSNLGGSTVPNMEDLPSPSPGAGGGSDVSPESISPQRPGDSGDWGPEETLPGRPRMTNTRRFSLEYDVETVGPEGLADVELWGTTDGGETWTKWGSDPDKISPFDVEVNGEGLYGFRVVIVGRNGLASNTPRRGDPADIWIGVDQTKPTARITAAAYGTGAQAGKLDIRWEASDANLLPRPITLSMSSSPDGPFTPIAAGLPNTGQYLWEFDPRSPRQIYLRLEVRDEAGNLTIDQLVEPIQVEGLAPKGRIRGFSPAAETGQQPFRSPLFR